MISNTFRTKLLFFATVIGILLKLYIKNPNPAEDVKGYTSDELKNIPQHFKKLLYTEREGVSLTVYFKNRLLLHLYGGYADKESNRLWENDTHTVVFSLTKAVTSMIISKLVSEGKLSYDTKITDIWSGYKKENKGNTTLRHILDHEAGLISFGSSLTIDDMNDDEKMIKVIEDAKPFWPVGSAIGYHAITRGFILNQIVRKVTGKSIGNYLKEEISPNVENKDFYIGLPKDKEENVARVVNPHMIESIYDWACRPLAFIKVLYNYFKYNRISDVASNYPEPLAIMKNFMPYNNPKVHRLEIPSAGGIGSSSGLGSLMSYFITSNVLSPEVKKTISNPLSYKDDMVLVNKIYRGYGFSYDKHPLNSEKFIISFLANGMQVLDIDIENEIVICLVRNGLRPGIQGHAQYLTIRQEIFKSLSEYI
uniref:Beta-lactamase domain-containing protein n=1 Tax=Parastrongyloides trichosuri TaxID=131310 RepID=A0A0N4ZAU8_PARTI